MEVDNSRRPPTPLPLLEHEPEAALQNLRASVDGLELLRQRKRELELLLLLRSRTLTVGDKESINHSNNARSGDESRKKMQESVCPHNKRPTNIGMSEKTRANDTKQSNKSCRIRSVDLKFMEDVSSVSCSGLDDSTSDQSSSSSDVSGPSHESERSRDTAPRKMVRVNSCKWLSSRNEHQGAGQPRKSRQKTPTTALQDAKVIVINDSSDTLLKQEVHSSDSCTRRSVATTTVTSATSDFTSVNEDVELAYPREKLLPDSASSSIATTPSIEYKLETPGNLGPENSLNAISVAVCDVSTITATSENPSKKSKCPCVSLIVSLLILFLGALLAVLSLIMKAVIVRHNKI